jgi:hypothetical protein
MKDQRAIALVLDSSSRPIFATSATWIVRLPVSNSPPSSLS